MKTPVEMEKAYPIRLHGGDAATTTDVWVILNAALNGSRESVEELADASPQLLIAQFDYTSPLHFAVREGHLELVRYFVEQGSLDPDYWVHPFKDSLVTIGRDADLNGLQFYRWL